MILNNLAKSQISNSYPNYAARNSFSSLKPAFKGNSDFNSKGLDLSLCTKEDLKPIIDLISKIQYEEFGEKEVYSEKIQKMYLNLFEDYFKDKQRSLIYVLKTKNNKVVGSGILSPPPSLVFSNFDDGKTGYISGIYIAKNQRGKHIGTNIVKHLIKEAKNKNYSRLFLRTDNPIAKHVYEKLGFKTWDNSPEKQALIAKMGNKYDPKLIYMELKL